ncbi:AraC family transcriptional regulator [Thauera sinica]|uniref:AraC family transcriptional regulator n=1 Tax=Thauera sinica TaxID=2665146 RepID=A0ABW1ALI6_9RHOO|nr:AraC family transcriptional regulator [Thauera sp. K11]
MLDSLLKKSTVFPIADPYQVSAYVNRHIGLHTLKTEKRIECASLRHARLDDLGLMVIGYGSSAAVSTPKLVRNYHLQLVINGECVVRYRRDEISLDVGAATLIPPDEEVKFFYSSDCMKLIVKIPSGVFDRTCREGCGYLPSGGVHFDKVVRKLGEDVAFRHMLELVCLEAEKARVCGNRSIEPLKQFLGYKLLEWFPHNVDRLDSTREDEGLIGHVDDYISENIHRPITVAELADHCNITSRTLQNVFSRHRGVSPATYIKRKRLEAIYDVLKSSNRSKKMVTHIAMDYGFTHLGRFAADYRKLFGEFPSETLRN